jgi:oligoendopeptidase F
MLAPLPTHIDDFMTWPWSQIAPYYAELEAHALAPENVDGWLRGWSELTKRLAETSSRLYVATSVNTADEQAEARYRAFLEDVLPNMEAAEQRLREKLLASGLEPAGFEVPLRDMRADAAGFREANLPLLTDERKLIIEHEKIQGGQTVLWEGEEKTLYQLLPEFHSPDRARREQVWRAMLDRWEQDNAALNDLWARLFTLRQQMAANADAPDYRSYLWPLRHRFDYTPDDCVRFHEAIEAVVVPAAARVYERRRARLGVDVLRPWDLEDGWYGRPVQGASRAPLKPFATSEELIAKTSAIFERVDPVLGGHFADMREHDLLDLDNRKNKAPGGYCTYYDYTGRPFIFMNAVGLHDDVQTLLHEGGHAFHAYESRALPYAQQTQYSMEIAEVASMAMELLAGPYLSQEQGGFYPHAEAALARAEHLERMLLFWPFMAVVDAFQHWAYTHPADAVQPAACEATWAQLWGRFVRGADWTGLERCRATGWQRKLHIFQYPFYYIEYGLAQLGAAQVWRNSLNDQAGAVAAYRRALALGATQPLPDLFSAAGARLAFDADTLRQSVDLIESTLDSLYSQVS